MANSAVASGTIAFVIMVSCSCLLYYTHLFSYPFIFSFSIDFSVILPRLVGLMDSWTVAHSLLILPLVNFYFVFTSILVSFQILLLG